MLGVMQDVKTDHAGIKIAVVRIAIHYRTSLSGHDTTSNLKARLIQVSSHGKRNGLTSRE